MNPNRLFAILVLALATSACSSVQPATSADMDRLGERIARSIGEAHPASPAPSPAPQAPIRPVTYTRTLSSHGDLLGNDGIKDVDLTSNGGETLTITVDGANAPIDIGAVMRADPALNGGNESQTATDRLRARYTPTPQQAADALPPTRLQSGPAPAGYVWKNGALTPCRR